MPPSEAGIDEATSSNISVLLDASDKAVTKPNVKPPRRHKAPWSESISHAMTNSREAHWSWTKAGRPPQTHPLAQARKTAQKSLRSEMRSEAAMRRMSLHNKLMETPADRDKLFYRLVAAQRTNPRCHPTGIVVDGTIQQTNLQSSKPGQTTLRILNVPSFNSGYATQVLEDMKIITSLSTHIESPVFSRDEVKAAIASLNNNRAADAQGLEYLKFAPPPPAMLDSIVDLFNAISAAVYIPTQLVCGDIITIPKKGKDPTIMSNHRGITITSVIGKVLEHTLVGRVKNILRDHQHHLQFGFTEKLSPSMAALVCTEVLANNKDRSQYKFVSHGRRPESV